ncbi:MAG: SMP-30/gluconolactonase/LRE family protein [Rhodobiaceae bacterium]|nr:SMP-30/gluconolactonase/LRE family protein [Rhodobiaceae bacterium]
MYVADIDAEEVYRVDFSGNRETVIGSLNKEALGAVNFVYLDAVGRLWVTVCTRTSPRHDAVWSEIPDGYILLKDQSGVRCVANELCFANEVRVDNSGEYLYVAETAAGHVTRFRIGVDGSLSGREIFGPSPLFPGAKIDGITFDCEGNLWVTELTQNALVVLKPDGAPKTIFSDPDGAVMTLPTSVTFGGDDLKTVFVGTIKMDRIPTFRSPVAGAPMYHW